MTKAYEYTADRFNYGSTRLDDKTVMTTIAARIYCNKAQVAILTFTGVARCHENDTFSYTTGVIISTLRAEQKLYNYLVDKNINQF